MEHIVTVVREGSASFAAVCVTCRWEQETSKKSAALKARESHIKDHR